jgi:hypothetical protein
LADPYFAALSIEHLEMRNPSLLADSTILEGSYFFHILFIDRLLTEALLVIAKWIELKGMAFKAR